MSMLLNPFRFGTSGPPPGFVAPTSTAAINSSIVLAPVATTATNEA